ncbi:hypothetical protein TAE01_09120 [Terrabacter aerolatus]|uniref:Helix-hairpin-helix DNA-binding motif class 1 domain-containing protein n=1 Tax=Terrabacter aerolatus TaxID=422442 RepID=A0A512CY04_9MICO|nr:hypothetical protein TAE01_09120 [Terrabacter aerolatus]
MPRAPGQWSAPGQRSEPGDWSDPEEDGAAEPDGARDGGSGPGEVLGSVSAAVRRLAQRASADDDEVARLAADLRRARRPGVLTVPDELRTGRRAVSSAAVVSLLALAVAVGCAFVLRVLWAERSASVPDEQPGASRSVQVVGGAVVTTASARPAATATGGPASPSGTAAAGPTGAEIVVHVVGQVVRPGLVRLRQGARVADAIAAAGGTRPGSDLAALNLARLVVDGEQIHVPRPGETPVPAGAAGGGPPAAGGSGASAGGSGAPVSLNSADATALDGLPGVGPVLAQRIIDWRTEHGRFTSVDELGEVSGIGDKLMAQLRPKVTL